MTEFYVIMAKRQDGKVYADLHKTNQHIYLTKEDAEDVFNSSEHYKNYYHIVRLIATLENESGGKFDPNILKNILTSLEEWIPPEISQHDPEYDRTYRDGWNNYRERLLDKLK